MADNKKKNSELRLYYKRNVINGKYDYDGHASETMTVERPG